MTNYECYPGCQGECTKEQIQQAREDKAFLARIAASMKRHAKLLEKLSK